MKGDLLDFLLARIQFLILFFQDDGQLQWRRGGQRLGGGREGGQGAAVGSQQGEQMASL